MDNNYYVYLLTNRSRTLYIGITNSLARRVEHHKQRGIPGFTKRYNIDQLVYFESFGEVLDAIAREKQLKGWNRRKTIALIERTNPDWNDLAITTDLSPPTT